MADFQVSVRNRLLDDNSVEAAVGDNIHWVERPQLSGLPAITLQVVSDPRPQHLKGNDGARGTRVQLDAWGRTYVEALALARAAIAALAHPVTIGGKRFGATRVEGQRDLGEDVNGTFVHRQSVDLTIWHVGD